MTDAMTAPATWLAHYVEAGLCVLPLHWIMPDGWCSCRRAACPSPGKHPLTTCGKDDATSCAATVREWLAWWPLANWGIRSPVGVVVLDVDPRNGGDESMKELEARHGRLPETLTARTGSGGWHVWLSYWGPSRGRLAQGIDVKTHTGYVVVPPSRHLSGQHYEWTTLVPTAPAPQWVREMLRPPVPQVPVVRPVPGTARSTAGLVRAVAEAQEGERNAVLYWAACRAYEQGADDTTLAALVEAAESTGLSSWEASATVASAGRTVGAVGVGR